jgi:hypothetical protein
MTFAGEIPMSDKKAPNIAFFRDNLSSWLKDEKLHNKFIVIHDRTVRGAFDTFNAALRDAVSRFPSDEFVIQQVIDASEVVNYIHCAG